VLLQQPALQLPQPPVVTSNKSAHLDVRGPPEFCSGGKVLAATSHNGSNSAKAIGTSSLSIVLLIVRSLVEPQLSPSPPTYQHQPDGHPQRVNLQQEGNSWSGANLPLYNCGPRHDLELFTLYRTASVPLSFCIGWLPHNKAQQQRISKYHTLVLAHASHLQQSDKGLYWKMTI
jgi:hypothetical protein